MNPAGSVTGQAAARAQIERHLSDVLRALPTQVSLSRQHPRYPHARFSAGRAIPRDDGDISDDAPVNLGVDYWFAGFPGTDAPGHFGLIVDNWRRCGWLTDVNERPEVGTAQARTPDDCVLTVHCAGDLSISASSAGFPRAGADRQPMPVNIAHPLS